MRTNILIWVIWLAVLSNALGAGRLGDANGDGKVDSADAKAILGAAVSATVLGSGEAPLADVNGDGEVNVLDAVQLLKDPQANAGAQLSGFTAKATFRNAKAEIRLTFAGASAAVGGSVQVRLLDLSGAVLGKQELALTEAADAKEGVATFALPASTALADLVQYVVQVDGEIGGAPFSEKASLYQMVPQLVAHLFGPETVLAGSDQRFRVVAEELTTGERIDGAQVEFSLWAGQPGTQVGSFSGFTDARGVVEPVITVPAGVRGDGRLVVQVTSDSESRTLDKQIKVQEAFVTLLTTDKPLYQPGQTIHVRTLTLKKPEMIPASGSEMVITVADSKGNKVFRMTETISAYGVASAEFTLATELNLGAYTVSAAVASSASTEKQITVKRYVLPKFKVNLQTDKAYYLPGAKLNGTLTANYFFGKTVNGAAASVSVSKFDVEFQKVAEVTGTTDASGNWSFSLDLPSYFVGQPLQQGDAFVLLEATVTDGAGHKETITQTVPVAAQDLVILAVPEGGRLVSGVENKVFVLTTYPNSTPARTHCEITLGAQSVALDTDDVGIGVATLTPAGSSSLTMNIRARDANGHSAEKAFTLAMSQSSDALLLRTDRTLYSVGEEVLVDIFGSATGGSIFVDLLKEGQTIYSRILDPEGGRTSLVIPLSAEMSGSLCLSAYRITAGSDTVRDRKLIYVDPANELRLSYSPDKDTYLPGEPATIRVSVRGKDDEPTVAAVGLNIVDEAVFALQEMQPGMEKVYFYLEEQLRKPRYEIHGFEPDTIIGQPDPVLDTRRDQALGLMFATLAQGQTGAFELSSRSGDSQKLRQTLVQMLWKDLRHLVDPLSDLFRSYPADQPETFLDQAIADAVRKGTLKQDDSLDPWGMPYRISYQQSVDQYAFKSAGPDERWNTGDDLLVAVATAVLRDPWMRENPWWEFGPVAWMRGDVLDAVTTGFPPPIEDQDGNAGGGGAGGDSKSNGETPYLRQYFPETLYSNPAIITGPDGTAEVNLAMADSITSWRLTGLASSADGRMGSATGAIRSFQEFFVDLDLPATLTRGDEVSVPVAIYNYLTTAQDIRLVADGGDSFELLDPAEQTVRIDANQVAAAHFRVRAKAVGLHKLKVTAFGSARSDALVRQVEIVPDGSEVLVTHSGRLEGTVEHQIDIPNEAIAGASKIFVKIYPGLFSQVVEGLDSLLQMPFGCFEQTSSVTYPNVLAVEYMKTVGQITPEILMKAEGFISAGYQRLLSYEVAGGGFEWFGHPPAHNVLTTYGLMEFSDMSKVWYVDPAVIRRTQDWLAQDQKPDGSWIPTEGGIAEGAIDRYQNDVLRTTAYVVWGLTSSGYAGPAVTRGTAYVKGKLTSPDFDAETYTLALCAHALLSNVDDPLLAVLFEKIEARKQTQGDMVWWENEAPTITYSRGKGADVELTALLAQAYMRYGRDADTAAKALNYLIHSKDPGGNFGSTQATVLALKAFCMAAGGLTQAPDATVHIVINGTEAKQITLNDENKDLLFLCDLQEQTLPGKNSVSIRFEGSGSSLYQIVGRHYLPWKDVAPPAEELISISVSFDKTELTTTDTVRCTVKVSNNRPGTAKMVVVDVGIPPGFAVLTEDLDPLVTSRFQKYQVAGRQVIFYLDELSSKSPLEWSYRLQAKFPIRALTPESVAYEYYNPEVRAVSAPQELSVVE
ncbi:MAG: MG2 domain-containing protein [Verrucomicrobiia bacterium]